MASPDDALSSGQAMIPNRGAGKPRLFGTSARSPCPRSSPTAAFSPGPAPVGQKRT